MPEHTSEHDPGRDPLTDADPRAEHDPQGFFPADDSVNAELVASDPTAVDPTANEPTASDPTSEDGLARRLGSLKAQMVPSAELVATLTARIEAEPAHVAAPGTGATGLPSDRPSARPTSVPHRPNAPTSPRPTRRTKGRRLTPALFGGVTATALAAVMLIGGLNPISPISEPTAPINDWPEPVQVSGPLPQPPGDRRLPAASKYAEIYEQLYLSGSVTGHWSSAGDTATPASQPAGETVASADMSSAYSSSGTNTQVAGVDEGDIVKTDGSYLYAAHGREVSVIAAAGADTHEVAVIDVSGLLGEDEVAVGPIVNLMIEGTTLIIFAHGFAEAGFNNWSRDAGSWMSLEASTLKAIYCSIADPTNPTFLTTVSQSGSYNDSRLSDGVLYLVSGYSLSPTEVDPEDPRTFVPSVGIDRDSTVLAPGDVHILPVVDYPAYTVVTATRVADGELLDQESILGRTDTVYMSPESLYLATNNWNYGGLTEDGKGLTLPGTDQAYSGASTTLVRISLGGETMEVAAQTEIAGTLLNQFALDEYEGHLRVVTTRNDTSEAERWVQIPGLWILDESLTTVGFLPQLATNEQVKSVRFDQGVGYVVTYQLIDPLFTIDLTNPAAPVVQSELKIPGFSSYLHPFGEGLLLGIGADVTGDEAQRITGLKLSMFSVLDPFNVTEIAVSQVDAETTEVSEDHKAAWVDVERGLIGFPTEAYNYDAMSESGHYIPKWNYEIYSWDGTAFQPLATINLADGLDWRGLTSISFDLTTRGIRIEDALYLTTGRGVGVYEIGEYTSVATVGF